MDPRQQRAAARAAVEADPARAARYTAVQARILRRPGQTFRATTRATTTAQAWVDFEQEQQRIENDEIRRGGGSR